MSDAHPGPSREPVRLPGTPLPSEPLPDAPRQGSEQPVASPWHPPAGRQPTAPPQPPQGHQGHQAPPPQGFAPQGSPPQGQPQQGPPPHPIPGIFATGLYWLPAGTKYAEAQPVILETDGRTLHLRDATRDIFTVAGPQVSAQVKRERLDLYIGGERYRLLMTPSYTGVGFTDEMRAYVDARGGRCAPTPERRAQMLAAGAVIPMVRLAKVLSDSNDLIRPWRRILPQLGAQLR